MATNAKKSKTPVETIQHGELCAAIWKNDTPKGPSYSISFERVYTGEGGVTRYSKSFKNPQLPGLAELVTKAHRRVRVLSQHIRVS